MKRILIASMSLIFLVTFVAGSALAGKYKPGTYSGSAVGYTKKSHPGKIEVQVTVDANTIKDIKVTAFEQTTKGKTGKLTAQAKAEIPAQIIKKQSINIDSIAKASRSCVGIELAVAEALNKATVAYKDGTYKGSAKGYTSKKEPDNKVEVEVTIAGGKISAIKVPTFTQTNKGAQAKRNAQAQKDVPAAIIKKQCVSVDAVAKASMSSNAIKVAVARALEQAR